MDEIDMEVQRIMKEPYPVYEEIPDSSFDKIAEFFTSKNKNNMIYVRNKLNQWFEIQGAVIDFIPGSFTLYSGNDSIYSLYLDKGSVKLENIFSHINGSVAYHKNGSGKYYYIFKKPIKIKILLDGKILKHFDFEVQYA
jgi:hypothetical protein